jgi:hypothetical protein
MAAAASVAVATPSTRTWPELDEHHLTIRDMRGPVLLTLDTEVARNLDHAVYLQLLGSVVLRAMTSP